MIGLILGDTEFPKIIVEKLVKADEEEVLISTKYITNGLPKSISQSFKLIEKEMSYFLTVAYKIYSKSAQCIMKPSHQVSYTIEKYEKLWL